MGLKCEKRGGTKQNAGRGKEIEGQDEDRGDTTGHFLLAYLAPALEAASCLRQ